MKSFPATLIAAFALLVATAAASAQERVDFFNVDARDFPTIRATFLARDSAGAVVRTLGGALRVFDRADTSDVLVSMSPGLSPAPLSIVIVNQVRTRANEARAILDAVLRHLEMPGDEVAIITIAPKLIVNLPFTSSRTVVSKAANVLGSSVSGHIGGGLLDTATGALRLLGDRNRRRIVIHIADVAPQTSTPSDIDTIRQRCAEAGIALNTIAINLTDSTRTFERFAHHTGGASIEGVSMSDDLDRIVGALIATARETPATAEWLEKPGCELHRKPHVMIGSRFVDGRLDFVVPERSRPLLSARTTVVAFASRGDAADTTLFVRAMRWPVRIDDVTIEGEGFSLTDSDRMYPIVVQPGDSMSIGIRAQPPDSLYSFARVTVNSTACAPIPLHFSARGAMPALPPTSVVITEPRTAQRFIGNQPLEVHWRSSGRNDSVSVELSLGTTATWDTLAPGRVGSSLWWTTPPKPYDSVTFRVRQRVSRTGNVIRLVGGNNRAYGRVTMSPNGEFVAAPQGGVHLNGVYDIYFQKRYAEGSTVNDADFAPDGSTIAVGRADGMAIIVRVDSGSQVWDRTYSAPVLISRFSPDGRSLLVLTAAPSKRTDVATNDTLVRIVDIESGQAAVSITGFVARQVFGEYAPDGMRVATGGVDGIVSVWDARSGERLLSLHAAIDGALEDLRISPDGSEILTCSGTIARRWDAGTGRLIDSIDHGGKVLAAVFALDMCRIVTVGEGTPVTIGVSTDRARVWSLGSGALLLSVARAGAPITDVAIDRTGSFLFAGARNGEAHLWDVDLRDTAQATVTVAIDAADISIRQSRADFGVVRLGDTLERTFRSALCNRGNRIGVVGEWTPVGLSSGDVMIVSPRRGDQILPGTCYDVVLRHTPGALGPLNGSLHLRLADLTAVGAIDVSSTRVASFLLTTRTFDVGKIHTGDSLEATLPSAVWNVSDSTISVSAVAMTGDASAFELIGPAPPFSIAPGAAIDLHVRFVPTTIGPLTAAMRLIGTGETPDPEIELSGTSTAGSSSHVPGGVLVTAAPNPAHGSASLLIDAPRGDVVAIDAIDALGRAHALAIEIVDDARGTRALVDLEGLSAGAYRCRVHGRTGVIGTVGLLVQ